MGCGTSTPLPARQSESVLPFPGANVRPLLDANATNAPPSPDSEIEVTAAVTASDARKESDISPLPVPSTSHSSSSSSSSVSKFRPRRHSSIENAARRNSNTLSSIRLKVSAPGYQSLANSSNAQKENETQPFLAGASSDTADVDDGNDVATPKKERELHSILIKHDYRNSIIVHKAHTKKKNLWSSLSSWSWQSKQKSRTSMGSSGSDGGGRASSSENTTDDFPLSRSNSSRRGSMSSVRSNLSVRFSKNSLEEVHTYYPDAPADRRASNDKISSDEVDGTKEKPMTKKERLRQQVQERLAARKLMMAIQSSMAQVHSEKARRASNEYHTRDNSSSSERGTGNNSNAEVAKSTDAEIKGPLKKLSSGSKKATTQESNSSLDAAAEAEAAVKSPPPAARAEATLQVEVPIEAQPPSAPAAAEDKVATGAAASEEETPTAAAARIPETGTTVNGAAGAGQPAELAATAATEEVAANNVTDAPTSPVKHPEPSTPRTFQTRISKTAAAATATSEDTTPKDAAEVALSPAETLAAGTAAIPIVEGVTAKDAAEAPALVEMKARIVRATVAPGRTAGIMFANAVSTDSPVTIEAIEPDSPFKELLCAGDVVFAINGVILLGSTLQEASRLTSSSSEIKLSVAKYHIPTVHVP